MRRIDVVKEVLRFQLGARDNNKELLVGVYRKYGVRDIYDLMTMPNLPQPDGILRDRRRPEVLKEFPRSERRYKAYKSYKEEYSSPIAAPDDWMQGHYE